MDSHRLQALRTERDHHNALASDAQARKQAEAAQALAAARLNGYSLAATAMSWPQMVECVQQLEMLRHASWGDHWAYSIEMMRQRYGWAVHARCHAEWVASLEGVAEVYALV